MYRSKASVVYVKSYSDLKISDRTFAGNCLIYTIDFSFKQWNMQFWHQTNLLSPSGQYFVKLPDVIQVYQTNERKGSQLLVCKSCAELEAMSLPHCHLVSVESFEIWWKETGDKYKSVHFMCNIYKNTEFVRFSSNYGSIFAI